VGRGADTGSRSPKGGPLLRGGALEEVPPPPGPEKMGKMWETKEKRGERKGKVGEGGRKRRNRKIERENV